MRRSVFIVFFLWLLGAFLGVSQSIANVCDVFVMANHERSDFNLNIGDSVSLSIPTKRVNTEGSFLGTMVNVEKNLAEVAVLEKKSGRIYVFDASRVKYSHKKDGSSLEPSLVVSIDEQEGGTCFAHSLCNALRQRTLNYSRNPRDAKKESELLNQLIELLHTKNEGGAVQEQNAINFLKESGVDFRINEKTDDLLSHLNQGGVAILQFHQYPLSKVPKRNITRFLNNKKLSWLPFPWIRSAKNSREKYYPPFAGWGFGHVTIAIGTIGDPGPGQELVTLNTQSGWFEVFPVEIFREAEKFIEDHRTWDKNADPVVKFTLIDAKKQ